MLLFSSLLTGFLGAALVATQVTIPSYRQVGGQTRLLGSSFGVPGTNATFDYVVRTHCHTQRSQLA